MAAYYAISIEMKPFLHTERQINAPTLCVDAKNTLVL